jgi:hypothetical protein
VNSIIQEINEGKRSTGNVTIDKLNQEYIGFLGGRPDTMELFNEWVATHPNERFVCLMFIGALRPWMVNV